MNIVESGFYLHDEKSVALALYLLSQEKKVSTQDIIHKILEKYDPVLFFQTSKINSIEELRNKFAEPKILGRIIKTAISMNEPEIAIMAGE